MPGIGYIYTGGTYKVSIHMKIDFVKLMCKFFGILMRIQKKFAFVKVCYNWFTDPANLYIKDMVIKITLGASEKPYMKSLGIR